MPTEFLQKILRAQDNKCFFCECDLTEYKAIEHLTPVSKGGDNNFYNLVYSCKSCNSKKRQKTLEEFALSTGNIYWLEKWENLFIETL
jgi:5-methylcytosine-specific restriction endonuclease McrA